MTTKTEMLSVLDWCNKMADEGRELKLVWDGGGDSGWAHFQMDEDEVDNAYTRRLVDHIYDELDYGSWAGEFQASGEAHYDKGEQAFIGTDYYTEDEDKSWEANIKIEIPKTLWFDRLEIQFKGDGEPEAEFVINNGFKSPDHYTYLETLVHKLGLEYDKAIAEFSKENEYRAVYDDVTINRNEFIEEGSVLVHTITHIRLGTYYLDEKGIFLNINEPHFKKPISEEDETEEDEI